MFLQFSRTDGGVFLRSARAALRYITELWERDLAASPSVEDEGDWTSGLRVRDLAASGYLDWVLTTVTEVGPG